MSSFVLVSEFLISHSLKQFPSSHLQNRNCNRFQNLFGLIPRHAKLKTRSFLRKYPDKELFFRQSTKQRFVSCKLSTLYFPLFWNDQSSKLKAVNHQILQNCSLWIFKIMLLSKKHVPMSDEVVVDQIQFWTSCNCQFWWI